MPQSNWENQKKFRSTTDNINYIFYSNISKGKSNQSLGLQQYLESSGNSFKEM